MRRLRRMSTVLKERVLDEAPRPSRHIEYTRFPGEDGVPIRNATYQPLDIADGGPVTGEPIGA